MNGTLYGIGVGPGDSELLTLKAVRIIREAGVIVVPGKEVENSFAFQIAKGAVPEITLKIKIALGWPMTKDKAILKGAYRSSADRIEEFLRLGENVAFLTIGDVSVYSTYLYAQRLVKEDGFETVMVPGVPSFCAAASTLDIGLVAKDEMLHVIPASYQIEDSLHLPGTKVLMKAGSKIGYVKKTMTSLRQNAMMVERCGMNSEKIYRSTEDIPEDADYLSLIIVQDRR